MQEPSPRVQGALEEAVACQQAGRLDEAAQLCQRILAVDPIHADCLHLLGKIAYQMGRADLSAEMIRKAIAVNSDEASYHSHLGNALSAQGKPDDAVASYRRALVLKPDYAEARNNLGNALFDQGKLDEAIAYYRHALSIKPDFAGAYNNLGTALWEQGQLDGAVASFRQALVLAPDFAAAHVNLGNALFDQGKLDEAVASYRRAIALRPNDVEAHGNIGIALWDQGKLDEAEAVYHHCLRISPDDTGSLNNLASLLLARGDAAGALKLIERSLGIEETEKAKRLFAEIVQRLPLTDGDREIRKALVRALREPWARPCTLAHAAADLVKRDPKIAACVARANQAWPRPLAARDLFGPEGFAALAGDPVLAALLVSAPNVDMELERLLTLTRRLMLEAAPAASLEGKHLNFCSALARQCFINEYVFFQTGDEFQKVQQLRDLTVSALESASPVRISWLLAIAAYGPLHSLPLAARLLDRQWPESITAILVQQIREPEEERNLRAAVARLTGINDAVSQRVQNQYEENPYPRWVKLPPPEKPTNIVLYLGRKFPLTAFQRKSGNGATEILVAGCGTGQQSILTAQRNSGAHVLAIDLSLSSLAYAVRKTRELGLASIEYAQADILELGSLGRSFDVIECTGVLHHLDDPWAGLRVLLSLLRPGGFLRLGFYSEIARRTIVKARGFIAEQGYEGTQDQIRLCRQQLVERNKKEDFSTVVNAQDFFSASDCRDLIFHVQEHRMTLAGIDTFLRGNGLNFLGFEIENQDAVLRAYRKQFPDDPAATNLGHWHVFESENPNLFSRTYLFWVQKAGCPLQ